MELAGTDYLYALATVSITFVGFSALLLFFRQTLGGGLTKYDAYFTLSFIQPGFIVTAGALLPPLLALCGLPPETVWRVASALTAVPIFLFVVTVPGRRRAAVNEPMPIYVATLLVLQALGGLALIANAVGRPFAPGPGVYAGVMTWLLFTTGIAYLRSLAISIHKPLARR
jgi:hypothetical protein